MFVVFVIFSESRIDNDKFLFPGKAVGGRKAKENRLYIKPVTSAKYFQGFLGNISWLFPSLTNNGGFADKSKEKRRVVREQTKETKACLFESILLAKVKLIL